jgi:hypothetical protein
MSSSIKRYLTVGALLGALPAVLLSWSEIADRYQWKAQGGHGERSDWGEPVFLMLVLAAVLGSVGAVAAVFVREVVERWRTRRK